MFIPYNTDAPIYHFPAATIAVIVINLGCFIATGGGAPEYDSWILEYGNGFHPVQWISSLFFHLGVTHLAGNMLFLWVFGLVVEGKVGWRRFVGIYLGIGIVQNAVEQAVMLGVSDAQAGSAGASGVVFGLMAMSMIWAPRNEIQCLFVPVIRVFAVEISILAMSALYIFIETTIAVTSKFSMSSQVIHLAGAAVGTGVAVGMLRRGLVDCENWDLLSLWRGDNQATGGLEDYHHVEPVAAAKRLSESGSFNFTAKARRQTQKIAELIEKKKYGSALRELTQLRHLVPDHQLSQEHLGDLASGLYRQQRWDDVTPLIEEYIERFPQDAGGMRLRLCAILLEIRKRPRACLRCADLIENDSLRPQHQQELEKIRRAAEALIAEGHLELGE